MTVFWTWAKPSRCQFFSALGTALALIKWASLFDLIPSPNMLTRYHSGNSWYHEWSPISLITLIIVNKKILDPVKKQVFVLFLQVQIKRTSEIFQNHKLTDEAERKCSSLSIGSLGRFLICKPRTLPIKREAVWMPTRTTSVCARGDGVANTEDKPLPTRISLKAQ